MVAGMGGPGRRGSNRFGHLGRGAAFDQCFGEFGARSDRGETRGTGGERTATVATSTI
jgi:hypothetical protein